MSTSPTPPPAPPSPPPTDPTPPAPNTPTPPSKSLEEQLAEARAHIHTLNKEAEQRRREAADAKALLEAQQRGDSAAVLETVKKQLAEAEPKAKAWDAYEAKMAGEISARVAKLPAPLQGLVSNAPTLEARLAALQALEASTMPAAPVSPPISPNTPPVSPTTPPVSPTTPPTTGSPPDFALLARTNSAAFMAATKSHPEAYRAWKGGGNNQPTPTLLGRFTSPKPSA